MTWGCISFLLSPGLFAPGGLTKSRVKHRATADHPAPRTGVVKPPRSIYDRFGMNKRLEMLEKLVASGNADSFARYALVLEYRKEKRVDDSLAAFTTLREKDPDYLAMYLMAGQLLIEAGRNAEAKPWLEAGIELARRKGDSKALSELESALGEI